MSTLAQRLASAEDYELAFLEAERDWLAKARPKQVLKNDGWAMAIALSGRGFGKTLMSSSWMRRMLGMYPGIVGHVIAPTFSDLRGTVFEGSSGLLNVIPHEMVETYNRSLFELRLKNGSLLRGFSADQPDRLRGPQSSFVAGDELAAWPRAEDMLSNINLSNRIAYRTLDGKLIQPKRLYTTTPRPLQWLKKIVDDADHVVRGTTMENRSNLAKTFIDELEMYAGTQLYRQEVLGEIIDIGEEAIIKRSWHKIWPRERLLPWFEFVYVSMDTAFTEKTFDKKTFEPDFSACTIWGVFAFEKRWQLMLLECWHEQLGFPELVMRARKEMKATYGRRSETLFKPLVGSPLVHEQIRRPDLLIVEDKGSGISLRQMLSVEGVDSWPFNPGKADKMARLHAISHVAAAGRIWLPESNNSRGQPRTWVEPMLDEVCVYSGPGTTRNDDFVDSYSQAVRYFADRWLYLGVTEKIKEDTIEVDIGTNDSVPLRNEQGREVEAPYG